MSESWHDFIFGAFDPAGHRHRRQAARRALGAGPVAADLRLSHLGPGPAAGDRGRGDHPGAVPGGPPAGRARAGLTAAAVLAVTPVTVLLGRGNVSDSLLILLLVLAADATSAALVSGSLRQLLLAGVWVGLAFQAKMIQAWLVAARAGRRLPARRARGAAAHPVRARRAGRAGHRRGLPVLDDGGLAGPGPRPALRGRQSERLGVHAGLRLQRRGPADRALGHPGRAAVTAGRRRRRERAAAQRRDLRHQGRAGIVCWPARSRPTAAGCCRPRWPPRWASSSPGAARAGATRCAPPSCCGAAGGWSWPSSSAPAPT